MANKRYHDGLREKLQKKEKAFSYFLNKGLAFSLGMILTNNVAGFAHVCDGKKQENKEEELDCMRNNAACMEE